MAYRLHILTVIVLVVFGVNAKRNVAVLNCDNIRVGGDVDVSNSQPVIVPADCNKGQIQWHLPNKDTHLHVQFLNQNAPHCFTSRYPVAFAKYSVILNNESNTPYRGNTPCFSASNVEVAVATNRRQYAIFVDFET
ncbi:uncharacterized protein LOC133181365 [Saccostrea echinata]|uniref:uncharacterized protein LOC133181365 n=1 Tax=Saccostrea echinata TaxID=191078 RepID=UPI002A82A03E|nr:uncharacterized protein LOC133181365 [Saccostrea echinata]